jgi:hypothetical protein
VQKALVALVLLAVAGTMLSDLWPRPGASASTTVTAAQALTPPVDGSETLKLDAAPGTPMTVVPVSAKAVALVGDKAGTGNDKAGNKAGDPAAIGIDDETSADRAALEAAEKATAEARAQLATTRGALAKAERDAISARAELEALQRAKLAAERGAAEARLKLAALQKTADRARAEAAEERAKRLRATHRMRKSVYTVRTRPVTWCLQLGGSTKGNGRLSGFCKS